MVAYVFGALAIAAAVLAVVYRGDDDAPRALPVCGRTNQTIRRPAALPVRFPLPRGTEFASATRATGVLVVEGRVPLGLVSATRFFRTGLPRAGFRLGAGDAEPGREAESEFFGRGVRGRFKVRLLFGCKGASMLLVSMIDVASSAR